MESEKSQGVKPLVLNYKEAARLAGVDARTISKAVRLGQVPTVLIGGCTLIPRKAFTAYLDQGTTIATSADGPEHER